MRDLYTKNSDKGEGVHNPKNLADVICEWPLIWYLLKHDLVVNRHKTPSSSMQHTASLGRIGGLLLRRPLHRVGLELIAGQAAPEPASLF